MGGVTPQPLHDLFDCTQALKTKSKCNTACNRGQEHFAYSTHSAKFVIAFTVEVLIKSRNAKASRKVC